MKTYPSAQTLGFFDLELRVQWLEAKGNPLSRLPEWVETTDGAVYADSAEADTMLPHKQPRKFSGERAYRNRPLTDEQKASGSEPTDRRESKRQKSRIRARIEHVFGFMSQSMKGFYLRYIGRRRNAAAIGLINLIYNLARSEQMVRWKLRPRTAA
jgi:IS5 family transposase